MAKLPTKQPAYGIETTSADCSEFNGPVGKVVFLLWSSRKLIVPQPVDEPNENANRLPVF